MPTVRDRQISLTALHGVRQQSLFRSISIKTRSYDDQNGQKKFITEVVVDEAEFVESSGAASGDAYRQEPAAPTQSFSAPAPMADSVAASAPTAPNMQIDAPTGGFDEGQSGELPFEI